MYGYDKPTFTTYTRYLSVDLKILKNQIQIYHYLYKKFISRLKDSQKVYSNLK